MLDYGGVKNFKMTATEVYRGGRIGQSIVTFKCLVVIHLYVFEY